jgi:hypothetical protein
MRPITTTLLALTLASCASSCGKTPRVNWPSVVACTDVVRPDILPAVRGTLVGDPGDHDSSSIDSRAVEQLEELAQKHSASVVACLVDQAVHGFDRASPSGGAARPRRLDDGPPVVAGLTDEELAAARGRDFLQRVAGTRVEADAP